MILSFSTRPTSSGMQTGVLEEVMIYLPARINLLLLSATIGNGEEIAPVALQDKGKGMRCHQGREKTGSSLSAFFPSLRAPHALSRKEKTLRQGQRISKNKQRSMPHRGQSPPFGEIIRILGKYQLLPAIFFLKSRSECDAALKACGRLPDDGRDDSFHYTLEETLALPLSGESQAAPLSDKRTGRFPSCRTTLLLEIPCRDDDEKREPPGHLRHLHCGGRS